MNHEALPLLENDLAEPGVIGADAWHQPLGGPRVAVLCFFNDLLTELAEKGQLRKVHTLRSEIGHNPVYELTIDDQRLYVVHPGVGAPLAAGFMEETAALGVTTFVACGGAGALREDLALGQVMIVDSAIRDEGTSFHYAPPSRSLDADLLGVQIAAQVLEEEGVPHFIGRAWTTDAMLRETRSRVQRRVDEGCSMVEMEASALMAVAQFRGFRLAHLLYAGDMVAGAEWDSRHWDKAMSYRELVFRMACLIALRLDGSK